MAEENTVSAVALKLPSFWPSRPSVWFAQAEAQFGIRKITDDSTRYYYVVSALDQETAARISDILVNPPSANKYDLLKDRLLSTYGLSRRERAARLLRIPGMGDRKPSELMDEMLGLLDGHRPCFLFEQLFLEQMPDDVRLQLADADFSSPRQVALLADTLYLAKSSIRSPDTHVHAVDKGNKKKDPPQKPTTCFYHSKFGKDARKCREPCAYAGNALAGRQ